MTRIRREARSRRDASWRRTILGAMSEASVMVFSGGGPACAWGSRDAIGVSGWDAGRARSVARGKIGPADRI